MAALQSFFRERIREPLLLSTAERRAQSLPEQQRGRVRELSAAAQARRSAALELRDEQSAPAAITLYREAAALDITALLLARSEPVEGEVLAPDAAWDALSRLLPAGELHPPRPDFDIALPILSGRNPLTFDRLPPSQAREARLAVETVLEWLRRQYEPRSVWRIRGQRVIRLTLLVLACALATVFSLTLALSPDNLALDKPVTVSSRRPGSPDPARVVDGNKDGSFAFHTKADKQAWVQIDLGATHRVGRVIIANRGDGYFDQILPLKLELSEDAKKWREVAVRRERFTESDPWEVELDGQPARYARVRRLGRGFLWLSEIEVYAK